MRLRPRASQPMPLADVAIVILHNIHRMQQNRKRARAGKVRPGPETRLMLAARFRVLCADSGLNIDDVAKTLHVTPRTVRYWFSGKSAVPYAAYKLIRILRWWELPQKGFEGWTMHSGKLWTPEGRPIAPEDGGWWSLLIGQARMFRTMYRREAAVAKAMRAAGVNLQPDAPVIPDQVRGASAELPAQPCASVAEAAAKPPPNLFLEHFGTEVPRFGGNAGSSAISSIAEKPQCEMKGIPHG